MFASKEEELLCSKTATSLNNVYGSGKVINTLLDGLYQQLDPDRFYTLLLVPKERVLAQCYLDTIRKEHELLGKRLDELTVWLAKIAQATEERANE
ncbi:hypothetical protein ACRQFN_02205 [Actinotignum sp. GS-2025e]|uniref:hypothetical protein n=1 Tax=unclassified Actinotignum TaxID=2632702 RepID=UPI003F447BD9